MKILIAFCIATAAFAQQFEAASMKSVDASVENGASTGGPGTSDPDRIAWHRTSLTFMLARAYGVDPEQISGPAWLGTTYYSVEAVSHHGTTPADFQLMLQHLLADRFALTTHRDTKEVAGFELVVAKGGSKLKASVIDPDKPNMHGETRVTNGVAHSTWREYSMNEVAAALRNELGMSIVNGVLQRPRLINNTGIEGKFDITLDYAPARMRPTAPDDPGPAAPTIFTAMEQQAGLKLNPTKTRVDVIVVDHAERIPTAN